MSAAHVLVLDIGLQPLRIASWKQVAKKILTGKLQVQEYSKDHTITISERVSPMPSVVKVTKYFNRNRIRIKFSRINVYTRDRFQCGYCGERFMSEDLNLDHVTPRCQGGKTTWQNITTACVTCNTMKAGRTPEEADMPLLHKPKKPTWLPLVTVKSGDMSKIPEEWKQYWYVDLET